MFLADPELTLSSLPLPPVHKGLCEMHFTKKILEKVHYGLTCAIQNVTWVIRQLCIPRAIRVSKNVVVNRGTVEINVDRNCKLPIITEYIRH